EDYNRMINRSRKETILDKAAEFRRKTAGLITNEEIDKIFDVRDYSTEGTSWENDIFEGVFSN
ncbi:MAG: hypothetical protein II516_09375, partial [Treponema sp.]|nr:hypothetical protein [Treponema sp.]